MPVVLPKEHGYFILLPPAWEPSYHTYRLNLRATSLSSESADYMIMCFKAFNHMLEVLERAVGINTITFVQILP